MRDLVQATVKPQGYSAANEVLHPNQSALQSVVRCVIQQSLVSHYELRSMPVDLGETAP